MDWYSTVSNGTEVALAILKVPARVSVTDPRYAGPVLINPGGPGVSGVTNGINFATLYQTVLDSDNPSLPFEDQRFFDIISWDPRGVQYTTPQLPSIPDSAAFQSTIAQVGYNFSDPLTFNTLWAGLRLYGNLLSSANATEATQGIARFVSTVNVARDMIEIVERHGKWREGEAQRLLASNSTADAAAIKTRTRWHKGEEPVQLWGFSYGSFLAQTFATLYPSRVQRIVADGVVNAHDIAAGSLASSLADIDKLTDNFTASCATAGAACAMNQWAPGDPQGIKNKLNALLESLKLNPIADAVDGAPVLVRYSDVISVLFASWPNAIVTFPIVAQILYDLSLGNATAFQQVFAPVATAEVSDKAFVGIFCTDGDAHANATQEQFAAVVREGEQASPRFAGFFAATVALPCYGYRQRAVWRFPGPVGGVQTRVPLLFAAQALDPLTPARNAREAATHFPGSGVVEAQGIGHTSTGWPSPCTMAQIRLYFRTGRVPSELVECPALVAPFQSPDPRLLDGLNQTERTLWRTTLRISLGGKDAEVPAGW